MAWDTERTRRLLLDAGAREFGSHGLAGARIDRVSREAGVNRERIYSYFGSKAGLFEAVLADRLDSALDKVSVVGEGPEAIGRFAGDYFDAIANDPLLARLVAWEGLERRDVVDVDDRSARAGRVAVRLRAALPGATPREIEDLFLTIVTLSYCWLIIPNLERVITGDAPHASRRRSAIHAQIATLARSTGDPRRGGGPSDD